MGSTRLPGKILKPILGKPLLAYQLERVQCAKLINKIVVATSTKATDDPIVDLCRNLSIDFYRGSEQDVLARYHGAATTYQADAVVRLTSDCPMIDPEVIDKAIGYYHENRQYDYVSNTLMRSYPRGLDVEVFSFKVLHEAFVEATDQKDREHVTPYIYGNPKRYSLANITHTEDHSMHRWTVDTPEDFELIKRIFEFIYPVNPMFTFKDSLDIFVKNPNWIYINRHIEQKKLEQ
jgi:spore coat polysaccharide biosynthesis protein SpsF